MPRGAPGRPRKPPEERLSNVVKLRMADAEIDAHYRTAQRVGMSLAEYLRWRLRDFVVPKDAIGANPRTLRGSK